MPVLVVPGMPSQSAPEIPAFTSSNTSHPAEGQRAALSATFTGRPSWQMLTRSCPRLTHPVIEVAPVRENWFPLVLILFRHLPDIAQPQPSRQSQSSDNPRGEVGEGEGWGLAVSANYQQRIRTLAIHGRADKIPLVGQCRRKAFNERHLCRGW